LKIPKFAPYLNSIFGTHLVRGGGSALKRQEWRWSVHAWRSRSSSIFGCCPRRS